LYRGKTKTLLHRAFLVVTENKRRIQNKEEEEEKVSGKRDEGRDIKVCLLGTGLSMCYNFGSCHIFD
jgi:hypothetical protein